MAQSNDSESTFTVDGKFTAEGLSISVYDEDGSVEDEAWFTYDEMENLRSTEQTDFTFELGDK